MDLARFLAVAGEPLRDVSDSAVLRDAAIVSDWLSMDDVSAICAIRAQVESSRTPDVTRLDGFLLETASSHIDPEVRVRLVPRLPGVRLRCRCSGYPLAAAPGAPAFPGRRSGTPR